MSVGGTAMYRHLDPTTVPELVRRAVTAAEELAFELCVHPATGRLLQSLGAGVAAGGRVAEIGTGTGAGLAWLSSFADPGVSFTSIELDEARASAAQTVTEIQVAPDMSVIVAQHTPNRLTQGV